MISEGFSEGKQTNKENKEKKKKKQAHRREEVATGQNFHCKGGAEMNPQARSSDSRSLKKQYLQEKSRKNTKKSLIY